MRVYVDTGIFIDYLISRGHVASYLRSGKRRGRSLSQLAQDAEECFSRISKNHEGFTSSLTFHEVEEALYQELCKSISGVTHGKKYLIPSARCAMTQMLITTGLFNIQVLDLTSTIIEQQLQQLDFQIRGIRSGDSLHMTTAILNNADLILSADRDLLNVDNVYQNATGNLIRCWDTDIALRTL